MSAKAHDKMSAKALVRTTKCTTLNFSGSFYEQIDGVGMGSRIAPAFADIFMYYVI